ncbi:MAG: hypothetical protein IPF52_17020 [Saprospiraceae bacterium]|nr:hypothetical protein [Saprospiraceae bacterium]
MNLYNFVIKSIMLTFTVAICITGCQNRKSIAFEEISKYVVDSIIRKDCCDTIMLTKNVIVDLNNDMTYVPIILLNINRIDTNILYKPFKKIAIDNITLKEYLTNRKERIPLIGNNTMNDFTAIRPERFEKMSLIFSEIYIDDQDNAVVFVTTVSHNTNTYLIFAKKSKDKYVVTNSQLLAHYFPWVNKVE